MSAIFRRKYIWLGVGLLFSVALVLFFQGVSKFAAVCRGYANLAPVAEGSLPPSVSSDEAIVVLTGDRGRIPRALELLRRRQSPLLIISGGGKGITLTELVNQQGAATVNIHENWSKIILESNSSSTIENAYESGKILRERKIRRVILVTSDYHMARSLNIFKRVLPDLDFYPYPILSAYYSHPTLFSERGFNGLWQFWFEYGKSVLYRYYTARDVLPLAG